MRKFLVYIFAKLNLGKMLDCFIRFIKLSWYVLLEAARKVGLAVSTNG